MPKIELLTTQNNDGLNKTIKVLFNLLDYSYKKKEYTDFLIFTFGGAYQSLDTIGFIANVHNWINTNIIYEDDLYDESIKAPNVIIQSDYNFGDCDDFALLTKSILNFYNIKCDFILFGKVKGEFTHIANLAYIKNSMGQNESIYIDSVDNKFNVFPDNYNFYKTIG